MTPDECLDDDRLYAAAAGEPPTDSIRIHLKGCAACRDRLEQTRAELTTIRRVYGQRVSGVDDSTRRHGDPRFMGRYFVAGRIAEDEDFVIFRAAHSLLQADVFLHSARSPLEVDTEANDALIAECRRLNSLRICGVARVLDIEINQGVPALVVEFVEGERLDDITRRGAIMPHNVARIARQLADSLSDLHHHQVAHGGLSLASIVISPDGGTSIVDLGTAQLRRLLRSAKRNSSEANSTVAAGTALSLKDVQRKDVQALGDMLRSLLQAVPTSDSGTSDSLAGLQTAADQALRGSDGGFDDIHQFAAAIMLATSTRFKRAYVVAACCLLAALSAVLVLWFLR